MRKPKYKREQNLTKSYPFCAQRTLRRRMEKASVRQKKGEEEPIVPRNRKESHRHIQAQDTHTYTMQSVQTHNGCPRDF